jgi:hypothetical protein
MDGSAHVASSAAVTDYVSTADGLTSVPTALEPASAIMGEGEGHATSAAAKGSACTDGSARVAGSAAGRAFVSTADSSTIAESAEAKASASMIGVDPIARSASGANTCPSAA